MYKKAFKRAVLRDIRRWKNKTRTARVYGVSLSQINRWSAAAGLVKSRIPKPSKFPPRPVAPPPLPDPLTRAIEAHNERTRDLRSIRRRVFATMTEYIDALENR